MNYYPHHIGDFNNATRHLTRVERALYRDVIELYIYDERPPTTDFDRLARKLMAVTEEEKQALRNVLDEFFLNQGDHYYCPKCDDILTNYHFNHENQRRAGKASAEKRKQRVVEQQLNERSTPVEQPLNQPITNNQEPITNKDKPPPAARSASKKTQMPTDFGISERVRDWAAKEKHTQLDKHLAVFRISCQAKGYVYVDWDAAFMNAIRGNWAKIDPLAQQGAALPRKPDKYDIADLDYEKRYGTPESVKALTAKLTGATA